MSLDPAVLQALGTAAGTLAAGAFGIKKIRDDIADLKDRFGLMEQRLERESNRIDFLYLTRPAGSIIPGEEKPHA